MSYEIVYDKQFLKVKENDKTMFCPIILIGSSNCYDQHNKRSRNWWNFTYITGGKGFATMEEMIANAKNQREEKIKRNKKRNEENIANGQEMYSEEFSDDKWGYFTSLSFGGGCKSTFGQYKGLFKTGCQKAVTVEQLKQYSCAGVLIVSGYGTEEKLAKFGKKSFSYSVKTSQELIEKYREAEKYLEGTGLIPQIKFEATESIGKNMRKWYFKKSMKQKIEKEVGHYFIVKDFQLDNFVVRTKRNGYSYSDKRYAKKFRLPSQANAFAKKLSLKYLQLAGKDRFIVVPVEEKTTFYV